MQTKANGYRTVDLAADDGPLIESLVPLTVRAAAINSPRWLPDPERARAEIVTVAAGAGVCRALLAGEEAIGWAGAAPSARTAWELHPLLVDPLRHGGGAGRCLVAELERLASAAGALTMELSTSDATRATTLGGKDLFADPLGALARLEVLDPSRGHAFRFWQKVGYSVVGVLPDAEGEGVPSIRLAKSLGGARPNVPVVASTSPTNPSPPRKS